jgi:type I restriction enzyme S subunit
MANDWQTVRLGNFLTERKEFVTIDDFTRYKRARVQLHGKGIVIRDVVQGVEIKTKSQQFARTGEFLVAEIDAKVGGFGIVPPELDGAIVSGHYFLFEIDEKICLRSWLNWFVRWGALEEQVTARGSTNYAAIRPNDVVEFTIPLPPLSEQQRIVARVDALAQRVEEARGLRRAAAEQAEAVIGSTFKKILDEGIKRSDWKSGAIPEFAEVNPPSRNKINSAPSDLVSFVPMAAVDEATGSIARPEPRPFAEAAKGHTVFLNGDIIFARITPCMQNGKSAYARNLLNGVGCGSTEFHVIRPSSDVLGEWIHALVRHKDFRDDAAAHFKGTAGQQRVPQSFLEQKVILVPPLADQRRIVAYLDGLQAKVDELRRLQAATQKELDALMPSILAKAFAGEL